MLAKSRSLTAVVAATSMMALTCGLALAQAPAAAPQLPPGMAAAPPVKDDGTITVPSFELPFSSFASKEARDSFIARLRAPPSAAGGGDIAKSRQASDDKLRPQFEKSKALYPYTSVKAKIGNVPVETFTPAVGIAPRNKDRILIQVHGGGFVAGGGGQTGALESLPLSSVMRIKIIAVDYRLGPENKFPAASEDLETVYREMLKTYKPENIGIYGCSAGGLLSAESIPWFLDKKLPLPGAIAVLCASLHTFDEGDSAQVQPRLGSTLRVLPSAHPGETVGRNGYFGDTSAKNPLAVPAASKDVMKQFPPTLILTGTRAPEMSAAAQSHLELVELGVKSQLLLFDGMDHGFYSDPTLPESQTAYKLMARFFDENLGAKSAKK